MSAGPYILAIDQGTTSSRALLVDRNGDISATAALPLQQIYPRAGWVEHDATAIWQAVREVCRKALSGIAMKEVAAIGITNQRETTVIWDRQSGEPVHNAIVWQDRRTAPLCKELRQRGLGEHVAATTGLLIDPYFSATKINWLLENVEGLRQRAEAGDICFGTIDSWLIYKLTGGATHATDASNASRTMLFDIHRGAWDDRLLSELAIPRSMLPEVRNCQDDFGTVSADLFGRAVPILGVAGDQQAATFGQTCFEPGMVKATFGTGCFMMMNTGSAPVVSKNRMLGTVCYRLDGKTTYALEGSIFMAGATIQWLRDSLGLVDRAEETEALASGADPHSQVFLIPAFQGLGAPYWDAEARGAIVGLSRSDGREEIVRAGLESVAYQTRDLIEAMAGDCKLAGLAKPDILRVDGGMTANRWLMQFLADILGMTVQVAKVAETTALGAAFHAGLAAGVFKSQDQLAQQWRASAVYEPKMAENERAKRFEDWHQAVGRVTTSKI